MIQDDLSTLTTLSKLSLINRILQEKSYNRHAFDLLTLSQDSNPDVRLNALRVFWKLTDPDFVGLEPEIIELNSDFIAPLIQIVDSDPVLEVRTEAARGLARFIYEGFRMENLDESLFETIRDFLFSVYENADQPVELRRTCLEALSYITDTEMEAIIREAYLCEDPRMKVSALFAMGRSGMDSVWDSILLQEMQNPDPDMRFEAVRAAGETYLMSATEILKERAHDKERRIQLQALHAMGNIGDRSIGPLLSRLTSSPDEDIRDAASHALHEMAYFQSESDQNDESP